MQPLLFVDSFTRSDMVVSLACSLECSCAIQLRLVRKRGDAKTKMTIPHRDTERQEAKKEMTVAVTRYQEERNFQKKKWRKKNIYIFKYLLCVEKNCWAVNSNERLQGDGKRNILLVCTVARQH